MNEVLIRQRQQAKKQQKGEEATWNWNIIGERRREESPQMSKQPEKEKKLGGTERKALWYVT